jgi:hypothetical protein
MKKLENKLVEYVLLQEVISQNAAKPSEDEKERVRLEQELENMQRDAQVNQYFIWRCKQ